MSERVSKRPMEDRDDEDLSITAPKTWAAGVPGWPTRSGTPWNNQTKGFDCPGCAWPEPGPVHRHRNEYCENGAKHVADEATTRRVTAGFFRRHAISELNEKSDQWLNQQGQLTEPMIKPPDSDHYAPIAWEEAFDLMAAELNRLDSPDEALFYTSGRVSNEGAFLLPTTCLTAPTCAMSPAVPR